MTMDVMVHVTSQDGASIAVPLMRALTRAGAVWGCFVTNDGVQLLFDDAFIDTLGGATRSLVCEHSWEKTGQEITECPIDRGSQTINSEMMGDATRLVSL
ncbi:MAG: hypothetical protein HN719_10100 [Alphaproteobacteria bacterium]|nr:hypothetical protein [Alphaproteobacteria bacterium]